jgi:putative sigma-54 modulation protein
MRLELTGRHVTITDAMRRIVDGKLARLERMLNDSAVSAQVLFHKEKIGVCADVTLHARGEKFLHGAGKAANWQGAVKAAVDKLAHQAEKLKGKYEGRKRGTAKANGSTNGVEVMAPSRSVARPRELSPAMVKGRKQVVRTLSLAEAAKQLSTNGKVLVFRNAETLVVSVLCRADGDSFTLVETDV